MKKISVAFFKGSSPRADIWDKIICWWTHGPYSHVTYVHENEEGELVECTASPEDGCVRCKPFNPNPEDWDILDFEISDRNYQHAIDFYKEISGDKYDWMGILGFVIPFIRDRAHDWFCSETVSNVFKIFGYRPFWIIKPGEISPNKLYKLLVELKRYLEEQTTTQSNTNQDKDDNTQE